MTSRSELLLPTTDEKIINVIPKKKLQMKAQSHLNSTAISTDLFKECCSSLCLRRISPGYESFNFEPSSGGGSRALFAYSIFKKSSNIYIFWIHEKNFNFFIFICKYMYNIYNILLTAVAKKILWSFLCLKSKPSNTLLMWLNYNN